ncbi:hypothetical protein AB6E21_13775 [Photobacterium swingsii]|uniref:hypothetical protein n=1 Tax=Photobacterium swingsii TaxID=680026 RepID=UPI0035511ED3
MTNKNVIVKARVDSELAEKFSLVCDFEDKKSSSLLRELIEQYCLTHEEALKQFDVKVDIGGAYGRGKDDKDEFEISAKLISKSDGEAFHQVNFILPEFRINGVERYRVDSFYYHRENFEGCINENGRLVGAKLTDGIWKGAVFLYTQVDIEDPTSCFADIKAQLRNRIMSAVIKSYVNNRKA